MINNTNIFYLKDEKMAIKIIDEEIYTYDIDQDNQINEKTEGKLLEISNEIYMKIENYYNIDLDNYDVISIMEYEDSYLKFNYEEKWKY